MTRRPAPLIVTALLGLAIGVGAGAAIAADGGSSSSPPAVESAKLPTVMEVSLDLGDCAYDAARGGMVFEDVEVETTKSGVVHLVLYVERDSLDDVRPEHVSYDLVFDGDTRRHVFDAVLPMSERDHAAGYDDCRWEVSGLDRP